MYNPKLDPTSFKVGVTVSPKNYDAISDAINEFYDRIKPIIDEDPNGRFVSTFDKSIFPNRSK